MFSSPKKSPEDTTAEDLYISWVIGYILKHDDYSLWLSQDRKWSTDFKIATDSETFYPECGASCKDDRIIVPKGCSVNIHKGQSHRKFFFMDNLTNSDNNKNINVSAEVYKKVCHKLASHPNELQEFKKKAEKSAISSFVSSAQSAAQHLKSDVSLLKIIQTDIKELERDPSKKEDLRKLETKKKRLLERIQHVYEFHALSKTHSIFLFSPNLQDIYKNYNIEEETKWSFKFFTEYAHGEGEWTKKTS